MKEGFIMKKILFITCLAMSSLSFSGLDAYIPLQTTAVDAVQMVQNGNALSQMMINDKIESEKIRIYNEGQGDTEVMLNLARQSKMARFVVPYFQHQAYQQQIYELNKLKLQKESVTTNSK